MGTELGLFPRPGQVLNHPGQKTKQRAQKSGLVSKVSQPQTCPSPGWEVSRPQHSEPWKAPDPHNPRQENQNSGKSLLLWEFRGGLKGYTVHQEGVTAQLSQESLRGLSRPPLRSSHAGREPEDR